MSGDKYEEAWEQVRQIFQDSGYYIDDSRKIDYLEKARRLRRKRARASPLEALLIVAYLENLNNGTHIFLEEVYPRSNNLSTGYSLARVASRFLGYEKYAPTPEEYISWALEKLDVYTEETYEAVLDLYKKLKSSKYFMESSTRKVVAIALYHTLLRVPLIKIKKALRVEITWYDKWRLKLTLESLLSSQ